MNDLHAIVNNTDKDNAFEILEVLKDSNYERTERIRALNGKEYIRKYFLDSADFPGEKLDTISKLAHPNLPDTHDYYQLADRSVIIQDYIHGQSLAHLVEKKGGLEPGEMVDIAVAICEGVEYMHGQRPNPLIHRDIKPDNIMISEDNIVKLIDFGAVREYKAQAGRDTVYVGTPGYASPEQFGFGQTDVRTDIYAIGQTMKHMLTGETPKRGLTRTEPAIAHQLNLIIEKAVQFDPRERYQKVSDLRRALVDYRNTIIEVRRKMFPIHNRMPFGLKIALLPVHLLIIFALGYGALSSLIEPSEFGSMDNVILTIENILLVFMLGYFYVIGFNIFNINERWHFLHTNRIPKKILTAIAVFSGIILLLTAMSYLHSDAYNLANSANS